MTQKKSSFPGLVPIAKRVFYGAARSVPKIRKIMNETPQPNADSNTSYEAMKPEAYRWFRQDETVRRCILTNAVYACLAAGFETEIEPLREFETEEELKTFQEQNKGIKDYIDAANRTVNLDYFFVCGAGEPQYLRESRLRNHIYRWQTIQANQPQPSASPPYRVRSL